MKSADPSKRLDRPEAHYVGLVVYALLLGIAIYIFGIDHTAAGLAWFLMIVFFFFFLRHLSFAISAARWVHHDLYAADVEFIGFTPSVAVLIACKNEELVIDKLLQALLALEYPEELVNFIIVDDGSLDATGAKLDAWALVDPRITVIHRALNSPGGKSGALNAALELVETDFICVFDADHEPARDVLTHLTRHFLDDRVDCVMGRCIIRNGGESQLAGVVFVDFLSGYLVNEYGRQALFELPAYGGANCAVRTSTLRALGGWNVETVTEDTDLTIRVILAGGRVRYDPTAVDYEEAVIVARRFWRQRYRWARGHQKCTRDYMVPALRNKNLSLAERSEFLMFLLVYHIPVLSGLGVVLTVARLFGVGSIPAVALLPLTLLLFLGPLAELTAGLSIGRVERRAAWHLLGFLPSFALSIVTTTWAYFDGMLGRPYSWVKTPRSASVSAPPKTSIINPPVHARRQSDLDEQTVEGAMIASTGLVIRSRGGKRSNTVGTKSFARSIERETE